MIGRLAATAAGYALAEILVTLVVGRFLAWGRAEPALFLAFRPWLLLALALIVAHRPRGERLVLYPVALLLTVAGEAVLLHGFGAVPPVGEMLRAALIGLLVLLLFDAGIAFALQRWARKGRGAAALVAIILLAVPGGLLVQHGRLASPPEPAPPVSRPPLALMTALPIVWGESGAFDPESRPAASYLALGQAFDIRLLDALDPAALGRARLLLLAQPRALAPEELVALDAWVRAGGRLLLLADPALVWDSALPLGDIRRPPPAVALAPLFDHWGVALDAGRPELVIDHFRQNGVSRRLSLAAPGAFSTSGADCHVQGRAWLARCDIGRGTALLVADADLLDDRWWTAPITDGDSRQARLADNPWIVAAWLDRLAGAVREPPGGAVAWRDPGKSAALAIALACLPLIAIVIVKVTGGRRRR